jgi:acyl-CoA thioesterase
MKDTSTPETTARATRDAMAAADAVLHTLHIDIGDVGPGWAVATMPVRAEMLNGFAICHGGVVATLADAAFAYACNTHDERTLAAGFAIDLLLPAREGDVLTAEAREVTKSGRSGVYDVVVRNQRGERVALFRGRSVTMTGVRVSAP